MSDALYPKPTRELAARRAELAPATHDAFQAFCIRGHTRLAQRRGASEQEIMEAIWVAAEMRAGGAYTHSVIALDAIGAEAHGHRS